MSGPSLMALAEIERIPVSVAVFELDGTIVTVNEANARMFGRTVADLVGKMSWEYVPGTEHIWPDLVAGARRYGTIRGEIAIATPHGSPVIHYGASLRTYEGRTVLVIFSVERTAPDEAKRMLMELTR